MSSIPKIIHQIWYQGEANIPIHLKNFRQTCVDQHTDYLFYLWDKDSIENIINESEEWIKSLYYSYKYMIQRIDFAKYVILYIYGGIYLDIDIKCLKSINNILDKYKDKNVILSLNPPNIFYELSLTLVGYKLNEKLINNGVIITIKNHPLLYKILQQAEINKDTVFKKFGKNYLLIFYTTGPVLLTQSLRNYTVNDIEILSSTYFEACDVNQVKKDCKPPDYAVGLHVYENSWVSPGENFIANIYFFIRNNIILIIVIILIYIYFKNKSKTKLLISQ